MLLCENKLSDPVAIRKITAGDYCHCYYYSSGVEVTRGLTKDAKSLWDQGRSVGCVWAVGFCLQSVLFPWVVGFECWSFFFVCFWFFNIHIG